MSDLPPTVRPVYLSDHRVVWVDADDPHSDDEFREALEARAHAAHLVGAVTPPGGRARSTMTAPDDWPADQWRTAVEQFLDADAACYLSPSILHHQTVRLRVEQLKAMRDGVPPMNGGGTTLRLEPEPCIGIDE